MRNHVLKKNHNHISIQPANLPVWQHFNTILTPNKIVLASYFLKANKSICIYSDLLCAKAKNIFLPYLFLE